MPPAKTLTPKEIAGLRKMIRMGCLVLPACPPNHNCDSKHRGKVPYDPATGRHMEGWNSIEKVTFDDFERWAKEAPDCNWGWRMGKSYVRIDIDGQGGEEILKSEKAVLPDSWEMTSGGGGRGIFYKVPQGMILKKGRLGEEKGNHEGVELLGDGQQSVIPPSTHRTGKKYEWVVGHAPWEIPCATAPDWAVRLLEEPMATRRPVTDRNTSVGKIEGLERCMKWVEAQREQAGGGVDYRKWFLWISFFTSIPGLEGEALNFSKSSAKYDDVKDPRAIEKLIEKRCSEREEAANRNIDESQIVHPTRCETFGCQHEQIFKCFGILHPDDKGGFTNSPYSFVKSRNHESLKTFEKIKGYGIPESYFDIKEHTKSKHPEEMIFNPVKMATALLENEHWIVKGGERGEKGVLYHAENGIYRPGGENKIRSIMKDKLCEYAKIPSKNHVLEVVDKVRRNSIKWKNEIKDNLEEIPLKNGVYNWRIGEIRPYNLDKDIFFCQVPVEFNPNSKCPNIERFLADIVEPDTIQSLIDILALALYRKAVVADWGAIGNPASGKTTYGLLVTAFIGPENKCSISLQRLTTSPFAPAALEHKLINIYDDLGLRKLFNLAVYNAISGGGSVTKERKGVDPTDFNPYAVHLFMANNMPQLDPDDPLDAFFRRMHILKFPFIFNDNPTPGTNEKEKNRNVIETLTTNEELSGLLNLVLARMPEVIEKGPHVPLDSNDSMIEYMQSSSPFQAFVMKFCQLDREVMTSKELIRELATWYSDENGLQTISNRGIKDVMDASGVSTYQDPPDKDKKPRPRYWRGIKMKGVKTDPVIFEQNPVIFDEDMKKRIEEGARSVPKSQRKGGKSHDDFSKSQHDQEIQSQLSQDFTHSTRMGEREENESSIEEWNREIDVIPVISSDTEKAQNCASEASVNGDISCNPTTMPDSIPMPNRIEVEPDPKPKQESEKTLTDENEIEERVLSADDKKKLRPFMDEVRKCVNKPDEKGMRSVLKDKMILHAVEEVIAPRLRNGKSTSHKYLREALVTEFPEDEITAMQVADSGNGLERLIVFARAFNKLIRGESLDGEP